MIVTADLGVIHTHTLGKTRVIPYLGFVSFLGNLRSISSEITELREAKKSERISATLRETFMKSRTNGGNWEEEDSEDQYDDSEEIYRSYPYGGNRWTTSQYSLGDEFELGKDQMFPDDLETVCVPCVWHRDDSF